MMSKKIVSVCSLAIVGVFAGMSIAEAAYSTKSITQNAYTDWSPQINDNGRVVWQGFDGTDFEIFVYDNAMHVTTQLTNNTYEDNSPQINNNGQVVWVGQTYFGGGNKDIFFYDGTTTLRLTNNTVDEIAPMINDNGQIVWYGFDGTDYEIYLYSGASSHN
jgi:Tol biopolymer transport system component